MRPLERLSRAKESVSPSFDQHFARAVFIPILLMEESSGGLFREFAVTLSRDRRLALVSLPRRP